MSYSCRMHTICGDDEIGLQNFVVCEYSFPMNGVLYGVQIQTSESSKNRLGWSFFTYIVNHLGPNLKIDRVSWSILLGSKQPQLIVEIDPVDSVQWYAVGFFDVMIIVGAHFFHGSAIVKASCTYGDHFRPLGIEVPRLKDL